MLAHARGAEAADDPVILFNFHKRFQIHIGNARGVHRCAQQQIDIRFAVFAAADFPHAFADGRLAIQFAVIVAERALNVAAVRLANRRKPRARQARYAALREFFVRPHVVCAPVQRFKVCDARAQNFRIALHRVFDLRKYRVHDLLLARRQLFVFRQLREKFKPHQRIALGYVHGFSLHHRICLYYST